MTELTEAEREALGRQALGGASPSPLLVRAVERIVAARVAEAADAREAEVRERVEVYRGWVTHRDGSHSAIERWVRGHDEQWISLDSNRRTYGDIQLIPAALAPADNDGEVSHG